MSLILLNLSWIALWRMIKVFWINLICLVFRPPSKAHALNVAEKWHTAYHGTRLDLVRRILDRGDLLSPGNSCWLIDWWTSILGVGAGLTELLHIYSPSCSLRSATDTWIFHSPIIIMYICHAHFNALSARMIHSNLNTIIRSTRRAQSYQNNLHKCYMESHTRTHTRIHARTHAHTRAHTHTYSDCSRNWVLILVGAEILWGEECFQFHFKRWQGGPEDLTPSLISCTVSVDVKHHVYLLTEGPGGGGWGGDPFDTFLKSPGILKAIFQGLGNESSWVLKALFQGLESPSVLKKNKQTFQGLESWVSSVFNVHLSQKLIIYTDCIDYIYLCCVEVLLQSVLVPEKTSRYDESSQVQSLHTGAHVSGDTGSVGSILLPEPQVYTEKSRPENLGGQPIFFSPTLRYAGGADFCQKHRWDKWTQVC